MNTPPHAIALSSLGSDGEDLPPPPGIPPPEPPHPCPPHLKPLPRATEPFFRALFTVPPPASHGLAATSQPQPVPHPLLDLRGPINRPASTSVSAHSHLRRATLPPSLGLRRGVPFLTERRSHLTTCLSIISGDREDRSPPLPTPPSSASHPHGHALSTVQVLRAIPPCRPCHPCYCAAPSFPEPTSSSASPLPVRSQERSCPRPPMDLRANAAR